MALKIGDRVRVVGSAQYHFEAGVGAEGVVVDPNDHPDALPMEDEYPILVLVDKHSNLWRVKFPYEEPSGNTYDYAEDELEVVEEGNA